MKLHCIPILSALFTSLVCFSNPATKISDNSPSSGIVIRWNDCEQTIDGFGIAQAGWAKELFAFKNRKQVMDKMFGNDGLRLNILRGEISHIIGRIKKIKTSILTMILTSSYAILILTINPMIC